MTAQKFTDTESGNYVRFVSGQTCDGFQINGNSECVLLDKNTASLLWEALGKSLGLPCKVFRVGHIDIDSGDTIYTVYGDWNSADNWVKTWQRNAIPAWHCDESLREVS